MTRNTKSFLRDLRVAVLAFVGFIALIFAFCATLYFTVPTHGELAMNRGENTVWSDMIHGCGSGGGSGSMASGGNGSFTSGAESFSDQFNAHVMLLDSNGGIGGIAGQSPWVCLGVIPAIHPTKNVWLQKVR